MSDHMDNQAMFGLDSLNFWKQMNILGKEMEADPALKAQFEADPKSVLAAKKIDTVVTVSDDGLPVQLSEYLEGLANSQSKQLLFLPKLQEKAMQYGLNVIVNVTSHFSMQDPRKGYYAGLINSSHNYSGRPKEEIQAVMAQWLAREHADEFAEYDLFITRGSGIVRVQDMSQYGDMMGWYV